MVTYICHIPATIHIGDTEMQLKAPRPIATVKIKKYILLTHSSKYFSNLKD